MGQVPRTVAVLVVVLIAASPAFAQIESSPPQVPSERIPAATAHPATAPDLIDDGRANRSAEAAQWVRAYTEWKEWSAQWGNRRQPGWFTGYRDRRAAPLPPPWLADRCQAVFDALDPLMPACTLLREWNEGFIATQLRTASAHAVAQREDESNTIWWEHLHVDMLWPAMQWRTSTYGVIGMHAATTVRGRFQAFVAPGVMLLNLPSRNGTRAWKVAANYGIGYRLVDFAFPGKRLASLHANAARAWIMSDVSEVVTGRTVDFAGFSVTFKQAP